MILEQDKNYRESNVVSDESSDESEDTRDEEIEIENLRENKEKVVKELKCDLRNVQNGRVCEDNLLDNFLRDHVAEKNQHYCEECEEYFENPLCLKVHVKRYHESKVKCRFCSYEGC